MRRLAALAVVSVLAGCGGDTSEVSTPADVAEQAGCKYEPYQSEELYVKEAGKCRIAGQEVTIYTFSDSEGQSAWMDAATTFGGTFLLGDGWVVSGPRPALEAARAKAGGEIQ